MDYAGAQRIGFLKKHGVAHGGFVRVPHMIVILLVLNVGNGWVAGGY